MTYTPDRSLTDRPVWRKLIARTHPEAGGEHELFIWASELKENVAGESIKNPGHVPSRRTANTGESTNRVLFEPEDFNELTYRALDTARDAPERYAELLGLLDDCEEAHHCPLTREQRRGASYKRVATIGHMAGMEVKGRSGWYRLAESIPLSDRHAGHILSKLKRRGA